MGNSKSQRLISSPTYAYELLLTRFVVKDGRHWEPVFTIHITFSLMFSCVCIKYYISGNRQAIRPFTRLVHSILLHNYVISLSFLTLGTFSFVIRNLNLLVLPANASLCYTLCTIYIYIYTWFCYLLIRLPRSMSTTSACICMNLKRTESLCLLCQCQYLDYRIVSRYRFLNVGENVLSFSSS
jgi:hypothetical protein